MNTYETISEAIRDLKKRGFRIDFNLGIDGIHTHKTPVSLVGEKFKIVEVYRFEGDTNPDDEAVIYVIASPEGYKGYLLNGYGVSSDSAAEELIKELPIVH